MLFNLFKSKKKAPKYDYDLVGCIGKLPQHKEFIKYRTVLPELARLDQWYQAAYNLLSTKFGKDLKTTILPQMPICNYFYYSTSNMLPMAGTIIPSQDQSGRVYPCTIFRMLEHPLAREFNSAIPITYAEFFTALETLQDQILNVPTLTDVFTKIDHLNQTSIAPVRYHILQNTVARLGQISFSSYWSDISAQYPHLQLENFIQAVLNGLNILKQATKTKPWGMRLPLSSSDNCILYQVFWLQLIESMPQTKDMLIQVFWHQQCGEYKPCLTIFFKPMPPEYFGLLVDQTVQHELLFDVVTESRKVINISELAQNAAQDSQLSLLDILDLLQTK